MKDIDLAYMAGFFDGEGCISVRRKRVPQGQKHRHYMLTISVGQISCIPLQPFLEHGGKLFQNEYKGTLMYYWRLSGYDATDFLKLILPYLLLKKELAELAIEFQSGFAHKGTYPFLDDIEIARREELYHSCRALTSQTNRKDLV